MKIVCSFCNTEIRPGTTPDAPVSHGVCTSCYDRILASRRFNIRKFLNMLDAPVFLVDDDVNILAANTLALTTVKKPVALVQGIICGKVLDCINAYLPPGCGKTIFSHQDDDGRDVHEGYREQDKGDDQKPFPYILPG